MIQAAFQNTARVSNVAHAGAVKTALPEKNQ